MLLHMKMMNPFREHTILNLNYNNPENRDSVEFDNFVGYEKIVKEFKATLKNFDGSNNPFLDSIIYSLMFYLTEGKNIDKNKAGEVIGNEFYRELLEIKDDIKLGKVLFFLVNGVLAKQFYP